MSGRLNDHFGAIGQEAAVNWEIHHNIKQDLEVQFVVYLYD